MQGFLRIARTRFHRNIEEVDSLMRLIQVLKDAPRPEGRLDFDDDCHLLRALLECEMDLLDLTRQ
jgi:hypothetical protein